MKEQENSNLEKYYSLSPEVVFPSWRRLTAIGVLATIGTFGMQNYETIDRYYPFFGDGELVPEVIGCPEPPDAFRNEPIDNYAVTVADVHSSANNFDSAGARPLETIQTIHRFFDYPQERFTSAHSGIDFVFYSDKPEAQWTIDHEAFDDLFHFSLTTYHEYEHPHINYVVSCLRERIIEDNEFAGEEYSIYIPSNPRTCLGDGRVINLEEQPNAECKQRGFAPPKINLSLGPIKLFEGRVMILTGGSSDEARQVSMKRIAEHEALHAHTALPGEERFRLEANEKWVKYQEREHRTTHIEEYSAIPPFITYHDTIDEALLTRQLHQDGVTATSTNNTKIAPQSSTQQ